MILRFCLIFLNILFISMLFGCTGIRIQAKDGSIVYARILEFGQELNSEIIFVPRNYDFSGVTPFKSQVGLQWKSKYSVVGANALNLINFF